ncbi:MAG: hypothetical protein ABJG41_14070 [Cyclobacteriaceae bacterium]
MIHLIFLLILSVQIQFKDTDYTFQFYHIDNKVEIIVNDTVVYSSPEIDKNPKIEGNLSFNISKYLTDKEDIVIIKLYNGFEPYPEHEKDKHWEIEYSLIKNGKEEIEMMWDQGNNSKTGLVFKKTYRL